MKRRYAEGGPAGTALAVILPDPNVFHRLDDAARLAGVTRRALLSYCRSGFIRPVLQPPYGMLVFSEEAIHAVRRIEQVRTAHVIDMHVLKTMFDLIEEVEYLRDELRFLRRCQ